MSVRIIMKAYSLVFLFLATSICIAADPEKEFPIFSPTEIIKNGEDLRNGPKKVLVEFEVSAVQTVPTNYPDGSDRQVLHLVPAEAQGDGSFTAPISPEFHERLNKIGINDISAHFVGSTVLLEGYISGTSLNLILSPTYWTYHVSLYSFENIRSVKRAD